MRKTVEIEDCGDVQPGEDAFEIRDGAEAGCMPDAHSPQGESPPCRCASDEPPLKSNPPLRDERPGKGERTDPGKGERTDPGKGERTDPGKGEHTDPGKSERTDSSTAGNAGRTDTRPGKEVAPRIWQAFADILKKSAGMKGMRRDRDGAESASAGIAGEGIPQVRASAAAPHEPPEDAPAKHAAEQDNGSTSGLTEIRTPEVAPKNVAESAGTNKQTGPEPPPPRPPEPVPGKMEAKAPAAPWSLHQVRLDPRRRGLLSRRKRRRIRGNIKTSD